MTLRFFVFLLTVLEVVTLVASIKLFGFLATLGLCFLSMIIGGALLQRQGLITAEKFITRLEFGQAPMDEAWDGFCIMVAAVLFIIPGMATDLLALLLLIPPVRRLLRHLLVSSGAVQGSYWFDGKVLAPSQATVIEATWHEVTPGK